MIIEYGISLNSQALAKVSSSVLSLNNHLSQYALHFSIASARVRRPACHAIRQIRCHMDLVEQQLIQ